MMKLTSTLILLLFTQSVFAYEVPAAFRALLKNKKEQTYVSPDCEMKVYENAQGFFIDAYERDWNGEIDQTRDFGRLSITPSEEIFDYWEYAYGFDADIRYISDFGASFDHFTKTKIEHFQDGTSHVDISFKKSNGLFMYKYYHFKCDLKLK